MVDRYPMEFHPAAELFPLMIGEEFDELCRDIVANGLRERIWIFDGRILDGRNRYRACLATEIVPRFRNYEGSDPVGFVISLNLIRRHLNESQRAMVAARIANLGVGRRSEIVGIPTISQSEAANLMHVSRDTVNTAAKVQTECVPEVAGAVDSGTIAVSAAVEFAALPKEQQPEILRAVLAETLGGEKPTAARIEKACRVLLGQTANVHVSDDSYEWYTPAEYIEAARALMGAIDLDPASCETAQGIVKAAKFYSKAEDGLQQSWAGRVWLNPPYSAVLVRAFVDKLCQEHQAGAVSEALLITNNATDTQWFQELLAHHPVCFTRGRVRFWGPDRELPGPRQGQAVFYLGGNLAGFLEIFARFGMIATSLKA